MVRPYYTVGMYSPGNALVVYDIRRHVYGSSASCTHPSVSQRICTLPTAPSPVTTHYSHPLAFVSPIVKLLSHLQRLRRGLCHLQLLFQLFNLLQMYPSVSRANGNAARPVVRCDVRTGFTITVWLCCSRQKGPNSMLRLLDPPVCSCNLTPLPCPLLQDVRQKEKQGRLAHVRRGGLDGGVGAIGSLGSRVRCGSSRFLMGSRGLYRRLSGM